MLNLLSSSAVVTVLGLNVALIDIIVLAVLLVSVVIGALKGFVTQIYSILGGLVALILAIVFCGKLADFLTVSVPAIPSALQDKLSEILGIDGILLDGAKEKILESLKSTNIPAFLHELVADLIIKLGAELHLEVVIANWVLIAICFVSIFLISIILIIISKKLFKSLLQHNKAFGKLDRVLGAIFLSLKSLVIIIALFILLSLFIDLNGLLIPTLENGERINSVFNSFMTFIMNMPFIKNALIV